jgi:hypothetical protein
MNTIETTPHQMTAVLANFQQDIATLTERTANLVEAVDTNQYCQFLELMKKHGLSNRRIARAMGLSEATIRRDLATYDAIRSGNLNEIYGSDIDAASNDASPPLKAILRNLPKLTAAERDVVRKELDIADMGAA